MYAVSTWRLERAVQTSPWAGSRVSDVENAKRRGARLSRIAQCAFCHGADLGGRTLAETFALGTLDAPNLTPGKGGIGAAYTDVDYERAIRRGRDRAGRPLVLMPAQYLRHLTDAELADLIAYLRSVPAVDRSTRPRRIGPLSRLVLVAGLAPDLLAAEQISAGPALPPAADPGERLVALGGCRICHHPDLRGGRHPLALPDEPAPPDITASGSVGSWSRKEFIETARTGRTPEGRALDPRFMPWPNLASFDDAELDAIRRYLISTRTAAARASAD